MSEAAVAKKTTIPCPKCHHANRITVKEEALEKGQDEVCRKCGTDFLVTNSKDGDHLVAIEI